MYYDTKTNTLYASRKTLPYGRGQTSGLRVANDATLAARKAEAADIKCKAEGAKSVPALRAEVAQADGNR